MVIKWKRSKSLITWTNILVLSAWLQGGLLYFVSTAVYLVTGSQLIADGMMFAYYGLLILVTYRNWSGKLKAADIIFVIVLSLVVLLSYLLNDKNREYIEQHLPKLIFQVLPYYFVGLMIQQDKSTLNLMYRGSAVAVVVNWLYVLLLFGTGRQLENDNLAMSYAVLPHALMMLWYALAKMKPVNIILAALGMIFIMSMGSRGPLLSCVVFIALYLVYSSKKNYVRRFFYVILPAALVCVVLLSGAWEGILLWLRRQLIQMSMSTRIIDAVLYGAAEGSNNERMKIYQIILQYVKERPFTGYGIYSDWSMIGYYAHQIVLELWAHYGVIAGTILLLWGAWKILKAYQKNVSPQSQVFIMLLVSSGVIRCMYTGTYLSDYIFLLMGVAVSACRTRLHKRV